MRSKCELSEVPLVAQRESQPHMVSLQSSRQARCSRYDQPKQQSYATLYKAIVLVLLVQLIAHSLSYHYQAQATVLMRVCDTREIKTVTSRVCMLYKRTRNSGVKIDKQGNIRITRGAKGDYSPAKLASECCKIGCPPHIFAYNC